MTKESGVNAAQTGPVFAELPVESASFGDGEPPPPYTPQASDAITNQPVIHQTIIMQPTLKHFPIFYNCPKCQCQTLTKVKLVKTKKTHMLAGFICGFTCWCLICCLGALPYILPTFQEAEHYCSNCNSLLGKYSRL